VTHSNDGKAERGALRSDQNQLMFGKGFSFSGYERDPLYLNLGNKKFADISGVSGIDSITDGRAGVFADFDNDGDLDVFSTTIQNQSHLLFRNNVGQENNFLRIVLEGRKGSARDAFGAVVRVKTSAGTLTKIKSGGSGFISQNEPRLLFGLGKDEGVQSAEVTWADGTVERFEVNVPAGATLFLKQGTGKAQAISLGSSKLPDPLTKAEIFARGLKIAVGKALPDFPVRTSGGAAVSMRSRLKPGRETLINVWATWCIPCATEMPEIDKLRPALASRGIDVVGLNVDAERGADIKGYLSRKRVGYPIVVGGVPAIEHIYATDELSVPLSILVDGKGIVTELIPGWSVETRQRFARIAGGR
jgi:thiol-disulfide isomerase/thioredoxin